jgi:hypothetical protein
VLQLDPAQEARAFAAINGQVTSVMPTQIFHAELAAGGEQAAELVALCAQANVRILKTPRKPMRPGDTMAVEMLRFCRGRYGAECLVAALRLVTETGDGNAGYVRAGIIRGGCEALAGRAVRPLEPLLNRVAAGGVPQLYKAALRIRDLDGGALWIHYATQLTKRLDGRAAA